MYPETLVTPMRKDLTALGFQELKTSAEVETALSNSQGTTFVVINSVCGCAAGTARPGIKAALQHASKTPTALFTAFAGVDTESIDSIRAHTLPYPPSSPSLALFKNGILVHFVERHHIEGKTAEDIAEHLIQAFEEYC